MAPFFCPTKPPDLRTHHQPAQSTYENTGKKLRILTGTNKGVAADQVAAMAWLILGSQRHSKLVRGFFTRVEAGLSAEQRAEAEALANALERRVGPALRCGD